jgi:NMD protein affecting ribosome stability and mRNA decay
MRTAAKKYNTVYKKKIDVHRDTFLPRRSPKEIIQCSGCGAFYHRRRWSLNAPAGFTRSAHLPAVYCPACRKIKAHSVSGELQLQTVRDADRSELLRILRNEELKAREKNPLERIMRIEAANGGWKIATTTETLAQRLGRSIGKARGGELTFKWSHNNKFVRVLWEPKRTGPRR